MSGDSRCAAVVLLGLVCCSCAQTDEQAIRHVVTAELMERYRVSEDSVRIEHVESRPGSWVVRAEISAGGRAGEKRLVTCRVQRAASSTRAEARWTLTTVESVENHANRAGPER